MKHCNSIEQRPKALIARRQSFPGKSLLVPLLVLGAAILAPAQPTQTPFHVRAGKDKPGWDQKTQKRIEACAADYEEVLHGRKPALAQPDPMKESTSTDQYYQGDGYKIHVTKPEVTIDRVTGVVHGAIIDLESDLATGEMHSLLHTSFYADTVSDKPGSSEAPFHVGIGKEKPAWDEKAQKRIDQSAADYRAVIVGKKPTHAKAVGGPDPHFYKGDGYQIDIIEASITIGGVEGFLYGPMLELEPSISATDALDSISHVTFYSADELKKLLGR